MGKSKPNIAELRVLVNIRNIRFFLYAASLFGKWTISLRNFLMNRVMDLPIFNFELMSVLEIT